MGMAMVTGGAALDKWKPRFIPGLGLRDNGMAETTREKAPVGFILWIARPALALIGHRATPVPD